MKNPFKKPHPLDGEIDALQDALGGLPIDDPDYKPTRKALESLLKVRKETSNTISADTKLIVGANVLIALGVIMHEYGHAITSKAWGLMMRSKH